MVAKLYFIGFPQNDSAEQFKKQAIKYSRMINIQRAVRVTAVPGNVGWSVFSSGNCDRADIFVGAEALNRALKTCWIRALLHELCHVFVEEQLGPADEWVNIIGDKSNAVNFDYFLHVSPEGFTEFVVDEVYLETFNDAKLKKWFKPEPTKSVVNAYNLLLGGPPADVNTFSALFYLWRVNYSARRHNIERPTYAKMLSEIARKKRYERTLHTFDTIFAKGRPRTRGELKKVIKKLYQAFEHFLACS